MYLFHKIVLVVLFCVTSFVAWLFELQIKGNMISDSISLTGILFGFTITAVSAICGSRFLIDQHKIVDESVNGRYKSNAQRLVDYIEFASVMDIAVLLALNILQTELVPTQIVRWVNYIVMGLLVQMIGASYLVLRIVIKFIRSNLKEE